MSRILTLSISWGLHPSVRSLLCSVSKRELVPPRGPGPLPRRLHHDGLEIVLLLELFVRHVRLRLKYVITKLVESTG